MVQSLVSLPVDVIENIAVLLTPKDLVNVRKASDSLNDSWKLEGYSFALVSIARQKPTDIESITANEWLGLGVNYLAAYLLSEGAISLKKLLEYRTSKIHIYTFNYFTVTKHREFLARAIQTHLVVPKRKEKLERISLQFLDFAGRLGNTAQHRHGFLLLLSALCMPQELRAYLQECCEDLKVTCWMIAICIACGSGCMESVTYLINWRESRQRSRYSVESELAVLSIAIEQGNVDIVKCLLRHFSFDISQEFLVDFIKNSFSDIIFEELIRRTSFGEPLYQDHPTQLLTTAISMQKKNAVDCLLRFPAFNVMPEIDFAVQEAITQAVKGIFVLIAADSSNGTTIECFTRLGKYIEDSYWIQLVVRLFEILSVVNAVKLRKKSVKNRADLEYQRIFNYVSWAYRSIRLSRGVITNKDIIARMTIGVITAFSKELVGVGMCGALSAIILDGNWTVEQVSGGVANTEEGVADVILEDSSKLSLIKALLANYKQDSIQLDLSFNKNKVLLDAKKCSDPSIYEFLLDHPGLPPLGRLHEIFVWSCEIGDIERVTELIGTVDPGFRDNEGLRNAVRRGHLKIVETLINHPNVDPSACSNEAIRVAKNPDIIRILLSDIRVDPSDANHEVLQKTQDWEIVKLFLSHSFVDPAFDDNALLKRAVKDCRLEMVKHLLNDPRVDPSCSQNQIIRLAVTSAVSLRVASNSCQNLPKVEKESSDSGLISCQQLDRPRSRDEAMLIIEEILTDPRVVHSEVLASDLLLPSGLYDQEVLRLIMRNPKKQEWFNGYWALTDAAIANNESMIALILRELADEAKALGTPDCMKAACDNLNVGILELLLADAFIKLDFVLGDVALAACKTGQIYLFESALFRIPFPVPKLKEVIEMISEIPISPAQQEICLILESSKAIETYTSRIAAVQNSKEQNNGEPITSLRTASASRNNSLFNFGSISTAVQSPVGEVAAAMESPPSYSDEPSPALRSIGGATSKSVDSQAEVVDSSSTFAFGASTLTASSSFAYTPHKLFSNEGGSIPRTEPAFVFGESILAPSIEATSPAVPSEKLPFSDPPASTMAPSFVFGQQASSSLLASSASSIRTSPRPSRGSANAKRSVASKPKAALALPAKPYSFTGRSDFELAAKMLSDTIEDKLLMACVSGESETVDRLITESPDLDPSFGTDLAFRVSARLGHADVVRVLLRHPKVDPGVLENTALRHACRAGNVAIVEILIGDARVDPSVRENEALRLACDLKVKQVVVSHTQVVANPALQIARLLLRDPRVDPTSKNDQAVKNACIRKNVSLLQELLQHPSVESHVFDPLVLDHALPNQEICELIWPRLKSFVTSETLLLATEAGNHKAVTAILSDSRSETILAEAKKNLFRSLLRGTNQAKAVETLEVLLKDSRVDPNADRDLLVRFAVCYGKNKIVNRLLADDRIDPTIRNHELIKYAKRGTIEVLLSHKQMDPELIGNEPVALALRLAGLQYHRR
ncbi:hypothetical protein HDU67_009527 [Dinochytrium kinnereticum]|nr:hypothetical protein HDU67_009527 [Dinochytrium kinnereticum]